MQGFHAGRRHSGIGGADGKHGLLEYTETQVVVCSTADHRRRTAPPTPLGGCSPRSRRFFHPSPRLSQHPGISL